MVIACTVKIHDGIIVLLFFHSVVEIMIFSGNSLS